MYILRIPLLVIGIFVLGILMVVIALAQVLDDVMEPMKQKQRG